MKAMKLISLVAVLGFSLGINAQSVPDEKISTLRLTPLDVEATPPAMQKVMNKDIKQKRNYPMQPPVIPHKIDGYQLDIKVNKCMSCHARSRTEDSQAPMVSVTHYMDRENNFLAGLSPRRYFCTQCHVPQLDAKLQVESDFVDIDHLIQAETKAKH